MATTKDTTPRLYETEGPTLDNMFSGLVGHWLGSKGPTGFGSGSTAEEIAANWDGSGKLAIVTGASAGLGKESARVLAGRNCEVILACRTVSKGEAVAQEIKGQYADAKVKVMELDLSSLESVRRFAANFQKLNKPLNILLLNAGVMACPFTRSADGHEMQFATNHLGHFLLTVLLTNKLIDTAKKSQQKSRVVAVSSAAHFMPYGKGVGGPIKFDKFDEEEDYQSWWAYGQSKLCNVLFARELQRRVPQEHVVAAALHPGGIQTELQRHVSPSAAIVNTVINTISRPFFKSIPQGAATQILLATADNIKGGEYYADCNISPSSHASHDRDLGEKLWELSEKLTAVKH